VQEIGNWDEYMQSEIDKKQQVNSNKDSKLYKNKV